MLRINTVPLYNLFKRTDDWGQGMEAPRKLTSTGSYVAGVLYGHVSRAWLVHAPYRGVILTWVA